MTDRHLGSESTPGITLDDVISFLSFLGIIVSVGLLIMTAGGIDCDSITMSDGIKYGIIAFIVLIASVIGINKIEKGEESVYDRL